MHMGVTRRRLVPTTGFTSAFENAHRPALSGISQDSIAFQIKKIDAKRLKQRVIQVAFLESSLNISGELTIGFTRIPPINTTPRAFWNYPMSLR